MSRKQIISRILGDSVLSSPKTAKHKIYKSPLTAKETSKRALSNLSDTHTNIGHGIFGSVHKPDYQDDQDLGHVMKIWRSRSDPKNDITMQWLKYSARNAASNPHLPRIRSLASVQGSDGNWVHAAKMEKLSPARNKPEDSVIGKSTGITSEEHEIARRHLGGEKLAKNTTMVRDGKLLMMSDGPAETEYEDFDKPFFRTLNPQAKSAFKQMWKIKDAVKRKYRNNAAKSKVFGDLHGSNFMVRRTPTGPQYVFTDPLANLNDNIK